MENNQWTLLIPVKCVFSSATFCCILVELQCVEGLFQEGKSSPSSSRGNSTKQECAAKHPKVHEIFFEITHKIRFQTPAVMKQNILPPLSSISLLVLRPFY